MSSAELVFITRPPTSRFLRSANIAAPIYGCYTYQANQTIDKYTSNAFGVNGGVGMTYKFSRFAGEKFYVEARYVYTANSPRPFSYGDATGNGFNVFPQNSAKTTFIPVTFGVRF